MDNKWWSLGGIALGAIGLGVGVKLALDTRDELAAAEELNAAMKAQRRRDEDRLRIEMEVEQRLAERTSAAADLNRRMADSANQHQNTIFGKYKRLL